MVARRTFAISAGVIAVLILAFVTAWNWDPFHRRRNAELRAAERADQAAAAMLIAKGAQDAARQVDAAVQRRDSASAAAKKLERSAYQSEDANAVLAPDRARRLLEHDRELCRVAPTLIGCGAADRDAG